MKKFLIGLVFILAISLSVFFFVVPVLVENRLNAVLKTPPYPTSERARSLHQKLFVADLHADALLWGRNLLERSTRGHVDIPRLVEGHVALQAFTVVTKTPRGLNIERNDDRSDQITLLALARRWPPATWTSLLQRALYQARRLNEMADRSNGKFTVIRTSGDLAQYMERRRTESNITAGFLGVEGAHALDGDPANVEVLFEAGFRMMSPTHFFDDEMAGSAHGVHKGGLTEKGRDMIRRMEARRMLVDLAHASPQTIDDVLGMATRPVVVSHTGVKGICNNVRNLSDEHLKKIAATGGVIGIGYWETAVCGTDANAIVRAIRYTVDRVGVDHVALGSDFDGAVVEPFDTTGVVQITDALLAAGFSDPEIEKIMGGNVVRLLRETLP